MASGTHAINRYNMTYEESVSYYLALERLGAYNYFANDEGSFTKEMCPYVTQSVCSLLNNPWPLANQSIAAGMYFAQISIEKRF